MRRFLTSPSYPTNTYPSPPSLFPILPSIPITCRRCPRGLLSGRPRRGRQVRCPRPDFDLDLYRRGYLRHCHFPDARGIWPPGTVPFSIICRLLSFVVLSTAFVCHLCVPFFPFLTLVSTPFTHHSLLLPSLPPLFPTLNISAR